MVQLSWKIQCYTKSFSLLQLIIMPKLSLYIKICNQVPCTHHSSTKSKIVQGPS
uniref:Uncharacterized protein n=1 Tax=Rhizophora mucronata TaxID=61149 RepID=A0A2P2MX97_RHIMU